MKLTREEKLRSRQNGYVTLRGAVPRDMVDAARHAINHSLGEKGMDKQDLPFLRSTSYCKNIQGSKTMTGLVDESPALLPMDRSAYTDIWREFPGLRESDLSNPGLPY